MKGGAYSSMKTVADLSSSKPCVERERLREREREARAQMTFEADQRASQDMINSAPLFGEIVRVNPKSNDKERQQIERKLGRFEDVKHLLADQDVTNLFGVDGQPPPSPAPSISSGSSSSSIVGHEFKKPNACSQSHQTKSSHHHHHHHHHSSAQRNTFAKPSGGGGGGDGKSAYANRNSFYAAPSSKHGNAASINLPPTSSARGGGALSTAINSSSIGSVNNSGGGGGGSLAATNHHYGSTSNPTSSSIHDYSVRIQQSAAKNLPKINCELRDSARGMGCANDNASSVSLTNVENILDEMTSSLRTPLTAIAATPRKEVESKFTFNPISGKVESLLPLPRTAVDKSNKSNALNNVLASSGGGRSAFIASAFRNDDSTNVLTTPFSSNSLSAAGVGNGSSRSTGSGGYAYSPSVAGIAASSQANKEKLDSTTLPCLKSDLSLSEDTDDGDGAENGNDCDDEDDDDDDDDEEEDGLRGRRASRSRSNTADQKENNKYKMTSGAGVAFVPKKEPSSAAAAAAATTTTTTTAATKADDLRKCDAAASETRNTSSSDDSDSDSGSESEDSSSDSPSPPSLRLPVVTEQEESKHRWNLKNFLPPSAHGNSTPTSAHNSQNRRRQNCEKSKIGDSDSSAGSAARRKSRLTSCSTSDSDNDSASAKVNARSRKRIVDNGTKAGSNVGIAGATGSMCGGNAPVSGNTGAAAAAVSASVDKRRKYRLRSSSYSQSSDEDSDRASLPYVTANSSRINGSGSSSSGSSSSSSSGGGSCSGKGSVGNANNSCSTTVGGAGLVAANSLSCANNFASGGGGGGGGAVNSSGCATAGSGNVTVVGVVRPHQRKPPSPQIFHHNARSRNSAGMRDSSPSATNDERYSTFVQQQQQQQQQRTLHMTGAGNNAAPEPQCDLSASRADNTMVLKNMNRAAINDHYQQTRNSSGGGKSSNNNVSSSSVANTGRIGGGGDNIKVSTLQSGEKSVSQTNKTNASSKVRRKSKSPALASSNESPAKKKRGRKRTIKVPELTDSDEETPKAKAAPEKKRPGRPPLKRNDTDDLDWNCSSRRKTTDKFPSSTNVWCDRERRRSSLRMSSFTTVDSDSETEIQTATVKPTARVIPAVKRKDGGGGSVRINRDSSCESLRNDGDFNAISDGIKSSGGGGGGGGGSGGGGVVKVLESPPKLDVECIAVQDKKKSDTLRKLFSRREEGGGKTGGKGKGGKGKCGVIVMESEVERKLLQRSSVVSPSLALASPPTTTTTSSSSSSNLSKIQDRVPNLTHVAISSPNLQSNDGADGRFSEIGIANSGGGGGGGNDNAISGSGNNHHHQYHHHHHHHHHHNHHQQQQQQQQQQHNNHNLNLHLQHSNTNNNNNGSAVGVGQADAVVDAIPKLTYNEAGKPSLMCKIDLSKIPYILAKKRSEEVRIKTELPDTRQTTNINASDGVVVNTSSTNTTAINVSLIEPVWDRRRNENTTASCPAAASATTDTAPPVAVVETSDVRRGDSSKQHHQRSQSLPHTRKKHSSKKTKNSKRKHYADESRDITAASPDALAAAAVADDNNASIFATASTVHTPSVDTTDMDSSLSSDSEAKKVSGGVAANFARYGGNKNTKRSTAAAAAPPERASLTPGDSVVRNNLISPCYPMNLNDVQHQNVNVNAVVDQSSGDDESWDSSDSSCSNCSASSLPCHDAGGGGGGDKYSKIGKRSSQYRSCSKKKKKKLRNEHHSQRCSTSLGDCESVGSVGDIVVGGGDGTTNLIHLPNTSHERSSIGAEAPTATFNGYHQVAISDLVRPTVPTHHGIYYSYLEHKASEETNSESDNVSPNLYLMEAKRLKHAADTERDSVAQGMQYLEAILSFVLTGHVLERKNQMDTAFNMYSETLKLIVYISKKFRTLCTNATQSSIPNKIAILSLRCESILNLKLYTMREHEVKDVHSTVAEYFSKPVAPEACLMSNAAGIPSPHSPTPSPASSVGSNSSSGYSTGDRRSLAAMSQYVAVPCTVHVALQKQHNFYSNLIASFGYWEEADKLVFSGGNKDFFIELDRFCGPLTLHSSLKDLVHYVRVGIQRLKAIISHNHGV